MTIDEMAPNWEKKTTESEREKKGGRGGGGEGAGGEGETCSFVAFVGRLVIDHMPISNGRGGQKNDKEHEAFDRVIE